MFRPKNLQQEVWFIAFPMLLTGISTPLLGMVDTAVVGHLPHPYYLAAIALGSMLFNLLFWAMGFLRMGTTGLTARALGREDNSEQHIILYRGLVLAFFFGFLLIIFQQYVKFSLFYFVDTTSEVLNHAQIYFDIRIWTAPVTLATYVLLGWYLGLQKPGINLVIVICINLINIVLDIVFVVYLDMNSAGVAWATLIAEYFGFFLGLFFVKRIIGRENTIEFRDIFHFDAFKKYLALNFNVFLRTLFLLFSFSFFTLQSAKYGPAVLAANAILLNFQTLMAYGLDSLAHAAEVLVGKYYRDNSKNELIQILKITGYWSGMISIVFALMYWGLGGILINLLTNLQEVRDVALQYLPWLILSPLISVWSYWFDGIFIGAGYSRQMRDTMLFSFIIFMATWFLLSSFGNHGLWAALMAFMLARAVSMAYVASDKFKGLMK